MKPFNEMPEQDAKKIKYVLCDIDDTLTVNGKLPAEAFSAIWKLSESGIGVIPVTGRPAGWCDMIVREWPVAGVVGENGAFVYYFEDGHRLTLNHSQVAHDAQQRLAAVREKVLAAFPDARVSKDQFARIYDLAIDFNEDPPYLGFEVAEDICKMCQEMGAEAKVSSIHVNTWFGKYDKLSMAEQFLTEVLKETDILDSVLYFGDSPNDEPMFEHFPKACAVANIAPFVNSIKHLPTYVADAEGGFGFASAVNMLLKKRG